MIRNAIKRLTRMTVIGAILTAGNWSGLAVAETTNRQDAPEVAGDVNSHLQAPPADQGTIVVTATRRPEPLQKIPIAVSVLGHDRLRTDSLYDMVDIARVVPSLSYRSGSSSRGQALALRGVGTVSTSAAVEPSVAIVIDGVVVGRRGQAVMDFLDIDRLEVLRGPQGTLFGKNASAGVLNIVTRTPGDEVHSFFDIGHYGGGGEWRTDAGVSGPIAPGKLAASLTVFGGHYNGNVKNVWNGDTVNGFSRSGVRAKLAFTPSDTVKIQVTADDVYSKVTIPNDVVTSTTLIAYPSNVVTTFPNFAAALSPVVPSPDNREINSSYPTSATERSWSVSGQIDILLGDYALTSITGYRRWSSTLFQDLDDLPQALAGFPQRRDRGDLFYHQFSQELRLASPKQGFVDYQLGVYYFRGSDHEIYRRDSSIVRGAALSIVTGIATYGATNTSYAGFGEANLHFTHRFSAIAGFRVTHDKLDYDFDRVSTSPATVFGIPASFASSGKTEATGVSARAGLQYDVSRHVMAYFTYSRGYKGPAYNLAFPMLPRDTPALKPETSNAYEVGVKSRALGGAVLFNVAAFIDKFKNFQTNFFDVYNGSPVIRFINAGQVSTRGVEADLTAKLSRAFLLSGSFAYTDAHIDNFICPVGTPTSCNVNGKPLPFAPKLKGSIRASYIVPIGEGFDIRLSSDVSAQSEVQYSIDQTPTTIQPSYGLWNAEIGLVSHHGWELNLVVKNITNKSYSPFLSTFGSGVARLVPRDDKRYVGLTFRMDEPSIR